MKVKPVNVSEESHLLLKKIVKNDGEYANMKHCLERLIAKEAKRTGVS